MIFSEKVSELRKKNGWSQEELAEKLGVSRQAVSKWESASSIPDVDKIMKLSQIFSVSTDFLLNEQAEPDNAFELADLREDERPNLISLEQATAFLDTAAYEANKLSAAVSLCILSPIALIIMGGYSKLPGALITERAATSIGIGVLILLIVAAAGVFTHCGQRLAPYKILEDGPIELAYGVKGVVEKRKSESTWISSGITIGVTLCAFSVGILFMLFGFFPRNSLFSTWGICLALCFMAAAVFVLVKSTTVNGSFQKLLEKGRYSRNHKTVKKYTDLAMIIYFCVVAAIYLIASFITMAWDKTWLIWPVAGVLSTVIIVFIKTLKGGK